MATTSICQGKEKVKGKQLSNWVQGILWGDKNIWELDRGAACTTS